MFDVHTQKGFTGNVRVRLRPSRVQCEVLWCVTRDRVEIQRYVTWKDATDADVLEAYHQPVNDNDAQNKEVSL